jgi:phosphoacetylglucosamine mutase
MGGNAIDLGETTTPQIHFIVQQLNDTIKQQSNLGCPVSLSIKSVNITDSINNYYSTIASGYISLCETAFLEDNIINDMLPQTPTSNNSHIDNSTKIITSIVVDGSRGIGAISAFSLIECLNNLSNKINISLDLRNEVNSGPVNSQCGAEWVQKGQVPPEGVDSIQDSGKILCSFDGDADRIVFHSYLNNKWILYDGDKIAALIALFISKEVKAAGIDNMFSLGVVQTAYANGSSTNFLKSNNIPFVMSKTGVKYLHHKALEFDIGIYFEANGHGTVLFSSKLLSHVSSWDIPDIPINRIDVAKSRLIALTKVINQAVGDAVSDMLLVLAILHILKLDLNSWDLLYQDYPSKQTKVSSASKSKITCTDDETSALTPIELQNALNTAMKSIPNGRCFVRPSGTEDVVRVYAEALTQDQANQLANIATQAIIDHV